MNKVIHEYTDDALTEVLVSYLMNASFNELNDLHIAFFKGESIPNDILDDHLDIYVDKIIRFLDWDFDGELFWIEYTMKYAFGEEYVDHNFDPITGYDIYTFKSND